MSHDSGHHQPRKIDKKKNHSRGYSENVAETRAARVGFKRYLRELEEAALLDDEQEDEDE